MLFVDIVDEENSHTEVLKKSGANGNCISQKLTDELKMVYDKEMTYLVIRHGTAIDFN
jgi:hypothetical protein